MSAFRAIYLACSSLVFRPPRILGHFLDLLLGRPPSQELSGRTSKTGQPINHWGSRLNPPAGSDCSDRLLSESLNGGKVFKSATESSDGRACGRYDKRLVHGQRSRVFDFILTHKSLQRDHQTIPKLTPNFSLSTFKFITSSRLYPNSVMRAS